MKLIQEYEKKTNVKIEFEQLPLSNESGVLQAAAEKCVLAFQSGKMPDIVMDPVLIDTISMLGYGAQKKVLPISDYKDYTPYLNALLDSNPDAKKSVTALDGKIYGAPGLALSDKDKQSHGRFRTKIEINKKWLSQLGLSIPKTIDELKTVLRAFKTQNPSGRPAKDEIPLMINGDIDFFVAPFGDQGYAFANHCMKVTDDGKTLFAPAQESFKKGMNFFRELQNENLIDPDYLTQTIATYQSKLKSGRVGIVVAACAPVDMGLEYYKANYVTMEPITEKAGDKKIWGYTEAGLVTPSMYVITSKCKYPEAAARWADWFYSEEGAMNLLYGPEGTTWEKDKKTGSYIYYGNKNKPAGMSDEAYKGTLTPGGRFPCCNSNGLQNKIKDKSTKSEDVKILEAWEANVNKCYGNYKPKYVIPNMMMTIAQADLLNDIYPRLQSKYTEMYCDVYFKNKEINSSWDSYISALKKIGLADIESTYQKMYDTYNK
jgi:putative aldouronate transport system substrate-binding protein